MASDHGGQVFPRDAHEVQMGRGCGMTLRDYFAIHGPEPREEDILREQNTDRARNPHNDGPPKPRIREREEIVCSLRYRKADAMLAERNRND